MGFLNIRKSLKFILKPTHLWNIKNSQKSKSLQVAHFNFFCNKCKNLLACVSCLFLKCDVSGLLGLMGRRLKGRKGSSQKIVDFEGPDNTLLMILGCYLFLSSVKFIFFDVASIILLKYSPNHALTKSRRFVCDKSRIVFDCIDFENGICW